MSLLAPRRPSAPVAPNPLELLDTLLQEFQRCDLPHRLLRPALRAVCQGARGEAAFYLPATSAVAVETEGVVPIPPRLCPRIVEAVMGRCAGGQRNVLFSSAADPVVVPGVPPIHGAAMVRLSSSRPIWMAALRFSADRPIGSADLRFVKLTASMLLTHRRQLQTQDTFNQALLDMVRGFTAIIEAKDPYTRGHSERVAKIATILGRQLQQPEKEVSDLYLAGLLHDVGKIGIREVILGNPGRLTPEDMAHIQLHPEIGDRIVAGMGQFAHLRPGVRSHHERVDGTGYPDGLRGEGIPWMARVLAVADAYDAMVSNRPYRAGMSPDRIEQIFREGAGTQWDSNVVRGFLACRDEIYAYMAASSHEVVRTAVDLLAAPHDHQSSIRIR